MKYRVIETLESTFMPQCKTGWLRSWRFYQRDADTSPYMREVLILTKDPAYAATFHAESDAVEFMKRVKSKSDSFWRQEEQRNSREISGVEHVKVKRVDI